MKNQKNRNSCQGYGMSDAILADHLPIVKAVIHRYLWNREDRRDVFQTVVTKMLTAYKSFKHQCKLSTWAYRIAYNECVNQNRVHARKPETLQEETVPAENSFCPFEIDSNFELKQKLSAAMDRMGADFKQTVNLFYFQGFSGREGAAKMGIPEPHFYAKLDQARKKIKKHLLEEGFQPELELAGA